MTNKPVLGILLGDGGGVGPEIIAKLAADRFFDEYCYPVFIGDRRILNRAFETVGKSAEIKEIDTLDGVEFDGTYLMLNRNNLSCEEAPIGQLTIECGRANLDQLTYAVELYKAGKVPLYKRIFAKFSKKHHGEEHHVDESDYDDGIFEETVETDAFVDTAQFRSYTAETHIETMEIENDSVDKK